MPNEHQTLDGKPLHATWFKLENLTTDKREIAAIQALLRRMPALHHRDGAMGFALMPRKEAWKPRTATTRLSQIADWAEFLKDTRFDQATEEQMHAFLGRETVTRVIKRGWTADGVPCAGATRTYTVTDHARQERIIALRTMYKYRYPAALKLFEKFPRKFPDKPPQITRHDLPTAEEVRQVLRSLQHPCDIALFAVLAETGMRAGEIVALNVGSIIDGAYGTAMLRIPSEAKGLKTGPRDVEAYYCVPFIKKWLAQHPTPMEKMAPLFLNVRGLPGTRLTMNQLSGLVPKWGKNAGVTKYLHAHAFRSGAATDKASANFTVHHMQVIFGWAHGSLMPEHYSKIGNSDVDQFLYAQVWRKEGGPKLPRLGLQPTNCPNCNGEIPVTSVFCPKCGQNQPTGGIVTDESPDDATSALAASNVAALVLAGTKPA
ncbi:MAG: site-specific integrase [Candidatus Thermoplasmatota archaeon]|jgi:integrase